MKFSAIILKHPGMDFEARLRENTYNFSRLRGWDIELDGFVVVLTHADREARKLPPIAVPVASIERADILVDIVVEEDAVSARPKPPALVESKRGASGAVPAQTITGSGQQSSIHQSSGSAPIGS